MPTTPPETPSLPLLATQATPTSSTTTSTLLSSPTCQAGCSQATSLLALIHHRLLNLADLLKARLHRPLLPVPRLSPPQTHCLAPRLLLHPLIPPPMAKQSRRCHIPLPLQIPTPRHPLLTA
ncbi:hypothetical protein PtA15_16A138 [Puccinia triticina]|uniref:Uncharacterized protein n=1 Tax=Puccinia triticina TaxID=208348 RepID=A0ABY7DBB1_9BASI|nr:uncharacterized protein PtA15_16A138 [Puccinia triticina]WAQ92232.1 hypothetical protein PtA15_16A138 [Puccinia triticina]